LLHEEIVSRLDADFSAHDCLIIIKKFKKNKEKILKIYFYLFLAKK